MSEDVFGALLRMDHGLTLPLTVFSGGTEAAIKRIVGTKDDQGKYCGTLAKILALGGYEVKEIVNEGDMNQDDKNL